MNSELVRFACQTCGDAHDGECSPFACNFHTRLRWLHVDSYMEHMDAEHAHWREPQYLTRACAGCGVKALATWETVDLAGARCIHCPALQCPDCGGPDDRTCSCWVSIESLSLADKKALVAADATFDLGADGELTVA